MKHNKTGSTRMMAALLAAGILFPLQSLLAEQKNGSPSIIQTAPSPKPTSSSSGSFEEEDKEEVKSIKGKEKTLTLPLGISRTLEFPFEIGPIYVTDPSLFDYRRVKEGDKDKKLLILPKKPGVTDMTVHDSNGAPKISYTVRVTREDMGQVMSQLEELLGDVEGLKIKPLGGTVLLDGEILLPKDMVRIIRVVDAMKDRDSKGKEVPIRNLATISKVTMNIIAERIEREIGSPEITARVINNILFLEGTAESTFEADRAVEIAKSYLPEAFVEKGKGEGGEIKPKQQGGIAGGVPVIIDLMRERPPAAKPPGQDIKITMNYVELTNDYNKSFSFQWRPLATDNSTVKYDSAVGELSANLVATISSLLPKLVNAKSHGHARILKQEQLIVKDKGPPSIISNSMDLYSRIVNEKGEASLQPIPVNNTTKVSASTIPGSDSIDLGIQIELAQLVSDGPAPIVAKNSLQTQITIKNGDSAALGGYAVDQAVAGYNQSPNTATGKNDQAASSPLPLFDALSRSKSFRRDKQQYVIFVTPEVLRTASAGTEAIVRPFRLNAGDK